MSIGDTAFLQVSRKYVLAEKMCCSFCRWQEKLTNLPFSDFREHRILEAVFHYFCSLWTCLFHLVEALSDICWTEPTEGGWSAATVQWSMLDARWCWQRVPVFSSASGLDLSLMWGDFGPWDSLIWYYLTKVSQIPLASVLFLLLFIPMLTLLFKCIQRASLGGREHGHQRSGDVLNAGTINKSLIVKI